MAVQRLGRKVAGAGLALIGITVWVVAAFGPISAHPEVASFGVIFGGMLTMGGLALSFIPARHTGVPYFEEAEEVARATRRTQRKAADPFPVSRSREKARALRVALLGKAEPVTPP